MHIFADHAIFLDVPSFKLATRLVGLLANRRSCLEGHCFWWIQEPDTSTATRGRVHEECKGHHVGGVGDYHWRGIEIIADIVSAKKRNSFGRVGTRFGGSTLGFLLE